jgi:hypothetical protein
MKLGVSY